jgi:hypothetical protein
MMKHVDDKGGNELIRVLGCSDRDIEVWSGQPEQIKFCNFRDIDKYIDYNLHVCRNKLSSDYIYFKICEFKPLEIQFLTFFTKRIYL